MNTEDAGMISHLIQRPLKEGDRVFVTNGLGTEYEILGYGWSLSNSQFILKYDGDNFTLVSSLDWIHSLKVIYGKNQWR